VPGPDPERSFGLAESGHSLVDLPRDRTHQRYTAEGAWGYILRYRLLEDSNEKEFRCVCDGL
jgi:hypothetical protein